MANIEIIPAILTMSTDDLLQKIAQVDGIVDRVQIDVVGRAFSSEVTIGVEALEHLQVAAAVDVHLMVKEPITFLHRCDVGGVQRVFGHVEYMRSQDEFIEHAFSLGMEVGLALDLPTPVSVIERNLSQLDAVLLTAVPAGRSGQTFDELVLHKIRDLHALSPEIPICIDGGITPTTVLPCVEAGAIEFAVGSFLWESKDIDAALRELQEAQ